jgi:hypothetical protein
VKAKMNTGFLNRLFLPAVVATFIVGGSVIGMPGARIRSTSRTVRCEVAVPGQKTLGVLAQGANSRVDSPFVAVIRDASTYRQLQLQTGGLPDLTDALFNESFVVAAFAGSRPTTGYSVEIRQAGADSISIREIRPSKGSINGQMITSPFEVVQVKLEDAGSRPNIIVDQLWQSSGRALNVTKGSFTMTGGIAGKQEEFGITGLVRVQTFGKLMSLSLDLSGAGTSRRRALKTIATGSIDGKGNIVLPKFDCGNFVDPPYPFLNGKGNWVEASGKLSLSINSFTSATVSDGYSGSGSFEATSVARKAR